jgi:flagellar biosynthesis protein FlhG
VSATGEGRTIRNQLQLVVDRFVCPHLNGGNSDAVLLDLQGEIPTDPAVRDAVQRRSLLLEKTPGSPAARAVVAIAARMARQSGSVSPSPAASAQASGAR